jgi:hypothetical protein
MTPPTYHTPVPCIDRLLLRRLLHRYQPEILAENDATRKKTFSTMSCGEIASSVVKGFETLRDNFFL